MYIMNFHDFSTGCLQNYNAKNRMKSMILVLALFLPIITFIFKTYATLVIRYETPFALDFPSDICCVKIPQLSKKIKK